MMSLVVIGLLLRVWGLDFGLPNDSRPDENMNVQVVLYHLLDPLMRGDWRMHPNYFTYPSLSLYLVSLVYLLLYAVGRVLGEFSDWPMFLMLYEDNSTLFYLTLRWISALSGTAMIPLMYLLGRRLVNEPVGWVSAVFMTVSYLMVRNSHFGSVDTLMTLGVVASLWATIRFHQLRTDRALGLACVLIGLATGVKYPAALLCLPLWVALLLPSISRDNIDWPGFLNRIWKPTGLVVLVFLCTSPWVVLDFNRFLQDLRYEAFYYFTYTLPGIESGWLFYPKLALFHGLGAYMLLFAFMGLLRGWQVPDRSKHWLMWAFLIGYFILLGTNLRVMTRYALPLAPVILVYAAWGAVYVSQRLHSLFSGKAHSQLRQGVWIGVVTAVIGYQPLMDTLAFDGVLGQADTRSIARQWIMENIPPGQPIATGPRLGQIRLPANYGQLLMETGPNNLEPPIQVETTDINFRTRNINTYAQPEVLRQMGVRYVVLYGGMPLFSSPPWEMEAYHQFLEAGSVRLLFQITPLKSQASPNSIGRFDVMDAFYLPFEGFSAFERPGPEILVFELLDPQAPSDASEAAPS